MTPDLIKFTEKIPVLDQGFVRLVDVMGGDGSVVEAARVTTGKGRSQHAVDLDCVVPDDMFINGVRVPAHCGPCKVCGAVVACDEAGRSDEHCREGDRRLIRFMLRHAHWSPFEFAEMSIHLRLPMDVWRQLVRHWSLSVQEYSTRYSPAIDATAATAPDAWRAQGGSNRQGSAGAVSTWPEGWRYTRMVEDPNSPISWVLDAPDGTMRWAPPDADGAECPGDYLSAREQQLHTLAREVYEERLAFGVAREQARKDLPLSTYTEVYLKGNLRDWLNMLAQRLDPHAQHEIRQYAQAIAEIVKAWCPLAWEAFVDYRLEARTFSRGEVDLLSAVLKNLSPGFWDNDSMFKGRGITESERREFLKALGLA